MLGHDVVERDRWVRLEDIRLWEEDGWAREEEEWTMRREEEKEDATAMGERHARGRQEELAPEEGRRHKTRRNSECRGHAGAMIMPAFETLSRILSSAKTFP